MAFNISDFLNDESRRELKSGWKVMKISIHKLHPAEEKKNFYHIDDGEVEFLARTIELVGLDQYPVVREIPGTDEYEVIAGHKRRMAILFLLGEGKTEYEMVPCKVKKDDPIQNELSLIFTNSTQRERNDWEKMQEVKRVRELLAEYQKTHELSGKKQNIIAEILGMSKTKVGLLEKIDRRLIEPFREEFASGAINTATADKIAGLDEDRQQEEYENFKQTGVVSARVKEMKKKQKQEAEVNIEKEIPQSAGHKEEQKKQRGSITHEIRASQKSFHEVKNCLRRFELCRNERDYKTGDILHMYEYADGSRTGNELRAKITYVLEECSGLQDGYCVLGIETEGEMT